MVKTKLYQKLYTIWSNSRKYILFFMMYALFGWIYEVFLEVIIYKWDFSNRGFLFGPYCPVYGFGALMFIFLIYPLIKGKKLLYKIICIVPVFLGCALSATLLELITSYLMEFFIGSWPWQTYVDYAIHFQGRIALSPSIRFGIGGLVFLYIFQPLFEKLLSKIKSCYLTITSLSIISILLIDFIFTIIF